MNGPSLALLLHLDTPPLLPDEDRLAWWGRTGGRILKASARSGVRVGLALGGPVLDWLSTRPPALGAVREVVGEGLVELVASPFYGPALGSIPSGDGTDQILSHVTTARRLIDVRPRGCWLPRRTWDPEVPRLMSRADIDWTVVEDVAIASHHVREGIDPWGAWRTERGGHALTLLANDVGAAALRGSARPDEVSMYLKGRASQGAEALLFAWSVHRPQTEVDAEVGWLVEVIDSLGTHDLRLPSELARRLRGRVYLPSWAPEEVGVPWERQLLQSPQADRLHKRMLRVSRLLTRLSKRVRRNDPDAPDPDRLLQARRYLHRAQGAEHYEREGITDPALRARAWHDLLRAEGVAEHAAHLDRRLVSERVDLRTAGYRQVLLRTPALAAVIDPKVGGGLTELGFLPSATTIVDPDDRSDGSEGAGFVDRLIGASEGASGEEPPDGRPDDYEVVAVERARDAAVRTQLSRRTHVDGVAVDVHKAFSVRVEPRLDLVMEVHAAGPLGVTGRLSLALPLVLGADPEELELVTAREHLLVDELGPGTLLDDLAVVGGAGVEARVSFKPPVELSVSSSPRGLRLDVVWPIEVTPEAPARVRMKLELASEGVMATRVAKGRSATSSEGTEEITYESTEVIERPLYGTPTPATPRERVNLPASLAPHERAPAPGTLVASARGDGDGDGDGGSDSNGDEELPSTPTPPGAPDEPADPMAPPARLEDVEMASVVAELEGPPASDVNSLTPVGVERRDEGPPSEHDARDGSGPAEREAEAPAPASAPEAEAEPPPASDPIDAPDPPARSRPPATASDDDEEDGEDADGGTGRMPMKVLDPGEAVGDTVVLQRHQPVDPPPVPAHARALSAVGRRASSRSLVRPHSKPRVRFPRPSLYTPEDAPTPPERDDALIDEPATRATSEGRRMRGEE